MKYRIFPPPIHLKSLVQCFWLLESTQYEAIPTDYFLMADSCPEIIFQYGGGFKNYSTQSARIRFQHSVHDKFIVGNKIGFFGLRLYPHAVNLLLKMPADEVVNRVFDFSDLFKADGANLADSIYNAKNDNDRVILVSDFLSKRMLRQKSDPIEYFVDQVLRYPHQADVVGMQRASGLSVKQFERRFKAIAGFPPKYFARIARFQGVKDAYCAGRFESLTNLAYACNYYDQSHFNREFKEFSGVQPLQYFKSTGKDKIPPLSGLADSALPGGMQRRFDGYLPCGWFV